MSQTAPSKKKVARHPGPVDKYRAKAGKLQEKVAAHRRRPPLQARDAVVAMSQTAPSEKKVARQQGLVDKYRAKAGKLQEKVAARRAEKPEAKMRNASAKIGKFGRKIAKKTERYGLV